MLFKTITKTIFKINGKDSALFGLTVLSKAPHRTQGTKNYFVIFVCVCMYVVKVHICWERHDFFKEEFKMRKAEYKNVMENVK